MPPKALEIARKIMNKPVRILVKHEEDLVLEGIKQFCSGILQGLDYGAVKCQALVLAPNHELSHQS